jgi:glyoxylase-like metal-dependent hydrolase (beta-lactamase superfamily II)
MAPATFDRAGEQSRVHRQPVKSAEVEAALAALVACPTASIGTTGDQDVAAAARAFPRRFDGDVFHCGFHDEATFGATSWLLVRPRERGGNVLDDVPRWNEGLAQRIEALGGVVTIFLTHRDDVGAHARWAERCGARRVLHERDVVRDTRDVEVELAGDERIALDEELVAIPTPGHTAGSACLLARDRWLFTGDHLAFSRRLQHVYAFRTACWHDWSEQIASVERLRDERFEWILPGHGTPCRFPEQEMRARIEGCARRMRANPPD